MMPESKSAWRMALLAAYLRRKYRQRFYHVRVGGFPGWQNWLASEASYPLVLFGNHETWWDGLLDFSLARCFNMDSRLMMEARNLRRFPFFQRCGVFGVELGSTRDRAEGLLHALHLLRAPSHRRCLIIYPHGRLMQPWENTSFQPGLAAILRCAPGAKALPVWRRMAFGSHELPSVDIQIGKPVSIGGSMHGDTLEHALAGAKEALIQRLRSDDFEEIFYISQSNKTLHVTEK